MSVSVEREDWIELIRILKDVQENVSSLNGGEDAPEKIKAVHQGLQGLKATASMLELTEVERASSELDRFMSECAGSAPPSGEVLSLFGFALHTLFDAMENAKVGEEGDSVNSREISDLLIEEPSTEAPPENGAPAGPPASSAPEHDDDSPCDVCDADDGSENALLNHIMDAPSSSDSNQPDLSRLESIVADLGGKLSLTASSEESGAFFTIRFNAVPAIVEQLETRLSLTDPITSFRDKISVENTRAREILDTIRDFIMALTDGDLAGAEEILRLFSEQQQQTGLFNEIGYLARDLHNSIRSFVDTIDPALKEMIEDKIPEYGTRLEHIIEVTEKSAMATIDHVEIMQKRNIDEQKGLSQLRETIGGLRSIGEQARKRLGESQDLLGRLESSVAENRDDLLAIITAQDYQDITGQIIQKIIKLLKELETKMVNVIRTFGKGKKKAAQEPSAASELYGPAHKGKEALHSQDEVDDLLAEFGF